METKITAGTITDEQILELREDMGSERFDMYGQSWSIWQLCMDAMSRPDYASTDARVRLWERTRAREICADLYRDLLHCADSHCERPRGHAGPHQVGIWIRVPAGATR